MKEAKFCYTINTDCVYGGARVRREIYVNIEDHPNCEDTSFERLSVEDVKKLRDMCNQILKEVEYEDERHKAAEAAGK